MSEKYKNAKLPVDERVTDLISRMTLEEKAAQLIQVANNCATKEEMRAWAKKGAGSFLHVLGDNARELQDIAISNRLGIPVIFGIDAIHGHGLHPNAAIFPTQLAIACSWDPEIVKEMGRVTAREVAADGLHWTFSPVLCLGRDTRWGRVNETFGEDPYLAGVLGAAIIKGYQGDDLAADDSILACAKHYIGYGEATGGRDSCDTEMTFRKLREVFLPPFQKAVEAGCATIMTSYGSIDGTPFTASEKALKKILKDELKFEGYVVTDWNNVEHLVIKQYTAADLNEATKMAVACGNDMLMNTPASYEEIIKLVNDGNLDIKHVDEAVRRILRMKFISGMFEKPEKKPAVKIGCQEHRDAAMRAACDSIVLLENRGNTLPFCEKIKSIAVIGANGDDIKEQYGDWTYFTHPNPVDVQPVPPYFTVLSGLKEVAGSLGVDVRYHYGCHVMDAKNADIEGAASAAAACDAIVLVIGDVNAQLGEGKDRADLSLSGAQQQLFDRLRSLGKPLVTVLVASKPLCISEVAEKTDALIAAFNGGQYGGLAVAQALFGKFNPSGKLPISFPRHSGQLPVYYNYLPGWHGEKYCDLPEGPVYSFGYGLSYTKFEYSDLKADANTLQINVTVKNTGKCAGREIVQLYFRDVASSVMTPVKQLIAFEKVSLEPGVSKTVTFKLDRDALSLVNTEEKRVTEPGKFILMAGGDCRDESLLKTEIVL